MWHSNTVRLRKELELLDMFDRVHEYRADVATQNDGLYRGRQQRRSEILEQLNSFESQKGWARIRRLGSAAALLSATTYAMLQYVFK